MVRYCSIGPIYWAHALRKNACAAYLCRLSMVRHEKFLTSSRPSSARLDYRVPGLLCPG